jgi:hypothetical protein
VLVLEESNTFGCLSSLELSVKAVDGLSWQLTRVSHQGVFGTGMETHGKF